MAATGRALERQLGNSKQSRDLQCLEKTATSFTTCRNILCPPRIGVQGADTRPLTCCWQRLNLCTGPLASSTSMNVSNPMKANRSIRELALERLQDGVSTAEIAESLKVSKRTMQRWKKEGNNYGSKQVRLKSRKLTDEQGKSVLKFIEKKHCGQRC